MGVTAEDFVFTSGTGSSDGSMSVEDMIANWIAGHNAAGDAHAGIRNELEAISEIASGKVDSEAGKGLSANDYTDAEKQRVEAAFAAANANSVSIVELQRLVAGKVDAEQDKGLSSNDLTDELLQSLKNAAGIAQDNQVAIKVHTENAGVHVTAEDKRRWDDKPSWDTLKPSVADAENAMEQAREAADAATAAAIAANAKAALAEEKAGAAAAATEAANEAEAARTAAEVQREENEEAREAAEVIRQEQEVGRAEAEAERVLAESLRQEAESARALAAQAIPLTYANALKGAASGETVRVDDVSPVEHTAKAQVTSKNLFNPKAIKAASDYTTIEGDVLTTNFKSGALFVNQTWREGRVIMPPGTYTVTVIPVSEVFSANLIVYALNGTSWTQYKSKWITYTQTDNSLTFTIASDCIISFSGDGNNLGTHSFKVQVEKGDVATEYTPYIENPETVVVTRYGADETDNPQTYTPDADGTCEIDSISPVMTVLTDTAGANIDLEYNQDTNAIIEKLTQAIISLGGNV